MKDLCETWARRFIYIYTAVRLLTVPEAYQCYKHCPIFSNNFLDNFAMTEVEDETEDIVVEFEGNFDLDSVTNKHLQIIGIDTEEPVLKVDSKFYKIDIKDSIGSRLILEQKHDGKLEYYGKTDKAVTASRVIVKPK